MSRAFFAAILVALLSNAASASDLSAKNGGYISEIRVGGYYHNLEDYGETSFDVNAEVLFNPLPGNYSNSFAQFLLTPRPHVGATVNTAGYSSFLYTGVTWTKDLFNTPLFIEGAFGGAIHNGNTGEVRVPGEADLGCRVLFHEAASIGVNLKNDWKVMGTIEHFSNAGLCTHNQGMTNAGLRFGKAF